jgi:hypothetical protein
VNALVTGNLRHYKPLLIQNASVLSPAQFMEKFFPKLATKKGLALTGARPKNSFKIN